MHVNPLSKRRILVDLGGVRLVYARVERPDRWLRISKCTNRVPRVLWTMVGDDAVVYEYVEGKVLADLMVEALATARFGEAAKLAWTLGVELGNLHNDLEKAMCFEGRWDTRTLLEDRCRLARKSGISYCPLKAGRVAYLAYGHGDPHLYQAILDDSRIVFIDLDGEPASDIPGPPEYDLAAASRSIHYAAVMSWAPELAGRLAALMVEGYCRIRSIDVDFLVASYAARVVYEYYFEKAYRTGLEWIPESSLERLARGRDPVLESMLEVATACRG